MANYLCPFASFLQVLVDAGNAPQPNCLIWTYQAATSTPQQTFTDITGFTPNSNPIQLNSAGRLNNVSIWQPGGVALKIQFSTNAGTVGAPVFGVQIGPTFDQVSGIDDPVATLSLLSSANSGSGADIVANAMRSYDLVSSVRSANVPSLAAGQTLIIDIEGKTASTDGLGGLFYWNSSSTATDDGVNVIKPTAISSANPGRYLRQIQVSSGSGTLTMTGVTGSVTPTYNFKTLNGIAYLIISGGTGTSNSTAMTLTGLPAGLSPSTIGVSLPVLVEDNTVTNLAGWVSINTTGTLTFGLGSSPNFSGFTSSGTKGVMQTTTLVYPII